MPWDSLILSKKPGSYAAFRLSGRPILCELNCYAVRMKYPRLVYLFKKSILKIFVFNDRISLTQMLFKKGVLRNFPIITAKHLRWSLVLIKLQALRPVTLFKRDFNAGVFLWILRNFNEQLFFIEHLQWQLLYWRNCF